MAAFVVLRASPFVMWKTLPKEKACHAPFIFLTLSYHSFRGEYFFFTFDFSIKFGLGTAQDSLTNHNGRGFSTKDRDNDKSSLHCANLVRGAWWFNDCRESSLNGVYYHEKSDGQFSDTYCIYWGKSCPFKRAEMKMRPVGFQNPVLG